MAAFSSKFGGMIAFYSMILVSKENLGKKSSICLNAYKKFVEKRTSCTLNKSTRLG